MQLPDLARHDTLPKLLTWNAERWPDQVAAREKNFGIWKAYSWAETCARVRDLAAGLMALGVTQGDVVGIIGRNRPHWVWAELAAHCVGAMSLGIYEDSLGKEVSYLLDYGEVKLVFAEDEEQADKLLEIADQLPALCWIVYNDERGMRKYDDPRLISRKALIERGRTIDGADLERAIAAGKGDDVAILCTTSGTTSHPKLAMLQHRRFLDHVAAYLRADPREPTDEYMSLLPMAWIMEQVYAVAMPLVCRIRVNYPESQETAMHDLREIGPTHVLLAPRVWEQISADVHARMLDANRLSQAMFETGVRLGTDALERGRRSWLADALLYSTLRDRLGFSRVKAAATGGAALGPDTFKFFLAMGIPLRQLYGQTELCGAYTLQRAGDGLDFDSSGPPFDNTEIRIESPDENGVGEIVTYHPSMFKGYYKQPDATRETLTEDGWMMTGDAGFIDDQGRLTVIDRVKDMATTSRGVRFSPQFIENKLKFSPYIGECVVLGNGRKTVTAIICIRYSMVSKWAEARGLAFTTYTSLSALAETYALIQEEVEKVNLSLPPAQRIRRFLLLYKELDADDGELTRTRKVRRTVIDQRYAPIIDALYSGQHRVVMETEVTFEDGRTGRIQADMAIRDLATGETVHQEAAE
ncbi:MAG: long-chain fatty acid--CoA ligase [Rhizobiales bacterium]|nr:long-chain fatty acid--CoA ligase [Hyphomicrobiales bacterium]